MPRKQRDPLAYGMAGKPRLARPPESLNLTTQTTHQTLQPPHAAAQVADLLLQAADLAGIRIAAGNCPPLEVVQLRLQFTDGPALLVHLALQRGCRVAGWGACELVDQQALGQNGFFQVGQFSGVLTGLFLQLLQVRGVGGWVVGLGGDGGLSGCRLGGHAVCGLGLGKREAACQERCKSECGTQESGLISHYGVSMGSADVAQRYD